MLLWNVLMASGVLFFIIFNLLMDDFFTTFVLPIICLAGAFFVGFYIDNHRVKKANKLFFKKTGELPIASLYAVLQNDTSNKGVLMLTKQSLVFVTKKEQYDFKISDLTNIQVIQENTGQVAHTSANINGRMVGNSRAITKEVFIIKGHKNNVPYTLKWLSNRMLLSSRALNKFYIKLSDVGNFSSSTESILDNHKF
ncbi:hypothetical protein ACQKL0_03380 [Peribacillus sp. NPDC097264]|uniref:hypothetical protein n=1 Tax=Peribacillus sp. NPDC097264 TaxID=3390616 RepID=UPI003CFE5382